MDFWRFWHTFSSRVQNFYVEKLSFDLESCWRRRRPYLGSSWFMQCSMAVGPVLPRVGPGIAIDADVENIKDYSVYTTVVQV